MEFITTVCALEFDERLVWVVLIGLLFKLAIETLVGKRVSSWDIDLMLVFDVNTRNAGCQPVVFCPNSEALWPVGAAWPLGRLWKTQPVCAKMFCDHRPGLG